MKKNINIIVSPPSLHPTRAPTSTSPPNDTPTDYPTDAPTSPPNDTPTDSPTYPNTTTLCTADKPCQGIVTCEGVGCKILCDGEHACRWANIQCENCIVECTGHAHACRFATINITMPMEGERSNEIQILCTFEESCLQANVVLSNGTD